MNVRRAERRPVQDGSVAELTTMEAQQRESENTLFVITSTHRFSHFFLKKSFKGYRENSNNTEIPE